jgi:hypothetical protein
MMANASSELLLAQSPKGWQGSQPCLIHKSVKPLGVSKVLPRPCFTFLCMRQSTRPITQQITVFRRTTLCHKTQSVPLHLSVTNWLSSQPEGNGANRADRLGMSVAKYRVLPSFVHTVNYCVIYSSYSFNRFDPRACFHVRINRTYGSYRQSVGLLGRGISPWQDRYLHKHRINADLHTLSGFWTHDPSFRAGEHISCFSSRGHCDLLLPDL